ncbi:MAG: diguanylate cyclase [Sumerlaeia bacterium]
MLPRSKETPDDLIPPLRESLFGALDYSSLLERFGSAVERVAAVQIREARMTLAHPEDSSVRISLRLRNGILTGGRPYPAEAEGPSDEQGGFSLQAPALYGVEGTIAKRLGAGETSSAQSPPPTGPVCTLMLPLRSHRDVCGYMAFAVSKDDLPALETALPALTPLLAAAEEALPGCHEYERMRRERNDLQDILESATLLQSTDQEQSCPELAGEIMVERLNATRCLILSYIDKTNCLKAVGGMGFDPTILRSISMDIDSSDNLLVRTYRDGTANWLPEVEGSTLFPKASKGLRYHALSLPLLMAGRPIGVLFADHDANRCQVSPQRLVGLQLYANTVASAIEGAHLLARARRLAEQDGMTGLVNRRGFDVALQREVARAVRYDLPLSILMIDIDRFKKLNDTYSHIAGDEAIVATADVLRIAARETDLVARYGGDEFVVLMPNTSAEQAEVLRERILQTAREKAKTLNREHWAYSLSCGLRSAQGASAQHLLDSADKALYAHKEEQARRDLLRKLISTRPEDLSRWNHSLSKILRVLYEKEPYYHAHALRVMNLCVSIAQRAKWSQAEIEAVALAALLHDVGKISIPTQILSRTGPLSPREYELVQTHPQAGQDILKEVPYIGEVALLLAAHHERWDGETSCRFPAYPGLLKGVDIPIGARLIKIADSYDAMTTSRPYSTPMTGRQALDVLRSEAGKCFDPDLTKHFTAYLDDCERRPMNSMLP